MIAKIKESNTGYIKFLVKNCSAPPQGFEPRTYRLTGGRSTIEL